MDLRKFLEEEAKKFLDEAAKRETKEAKEFEKSREKTKDKKKDEASKQDTSQNPALRTQKTESSNQKKIAEPNSQNISQSSALRTQKKDVQTTELHDPVIEIRKALAKDNSLEAHKILSTIIEPAEIKEGEKLIADWESSQEIQKAYDYLRRVVSEGEVDVSLREYAHVKSLYDASSTETKKVWFEKVKSIYEEVRQLSNTHKPSFVLFKKLAQDIVTALDNNDTHKAEQLLIDARHRIAHIPNSPDFEKHRQILENVFSKLSSRTAFVKKHADASSSVDGVEEKYTKAVSLLQDDKKDEAKKLFEEIVGMDKNFLPARIRLEQLGGAS